jgi:hypothetical protein
MTIATAFTCEPLPDGNVLITFHGDDGQTCTAQVVTPQVIQSMPLVAALTDVALQKGPAVARDILRQISQR